MKALRGLKKQRIMKVQDPQKLAQQKLALLSDQAFIYDTQDNPSSQSWTISSFNVVPKTNDQLSFYNVNNDNKNRKIKQTTASSFNTHKCVSVSQQLSNQNNLRNYFKLYQEQSGDKKSEPMLFQQKKSLSLTNYILVDKRKLSKSQEKSTSAKYEQQRLKFLQLKKALLSRNKKRNLSSEDRLNMTETRHSSPSSKINLGRHSPSKGQQRSPKDTHNQSNNIRLPAHRRQHRSFSEAQTILLSLINRKEVPNINLQKYNKQYELLKEKMEMSREMEKSINSTKIKLHQYYQKFVY